MAEGRSHWSSVPTLGRRVALLLALWAAALISSLARSSVAREVSIEAVEQIVDKRSTIYIAVAALGIWAGIRRLSRSHATRSAAELAVAAVVAGIILGATNAGYDNSLSSYPTGLPQSETLTQISAGSPNSKVANRWSTFFSLGDLLESKQLVLPPNRALEIYFDHASDLDLTFEQYDYQLGDSHPFLGGEWMFDQRITAEQHLVVIGEGDSYRYYEARGHLFVIAEASW
jgi:hypothetical protein